MPKPIAVVTGASRGIGRAIAIRLAGEFDIVAMARSAGQLDELARDIGSRSGACRPVAVDLRDRDAIAKALQGVEAEVLVNNAGLGPVKPFLELSSDEWHTMVDVNFNALFHVTRALLPGMIKRRRGHVIVIGSIAARSAFVGGTCYAGTKHAAQAFVECLNLEVRDRAVKVSIVNPGSVATEFSHRNDPSWMLSPEEVAESVAHVIDTPPDVLVHSLEVRALTPKK
jgi:3-hydroxy acid dehydrogenase/malonic semialdehyde reductase